MTAPALPSLNDLTTPDELIYLGKHLSQELINSPVGGIKHTPGHTLVLLPRLPDYGFTTIIVKLTDSLTNPVIYNMLDALPEDAADELADFLFEVKDGLWNAGETK